MTLTNFVNLSSNTFEPIHILRKYLTNFFTFHQPDISNFIEENNIPEYLKEPTRDVLSEYSSHVEQLEIDLTAIEDNLTISLSRSGPVKENILERKSEMVFMYAQDSEIEVQESLKTFENKYSIYQYCLNQANFSYQNKYHFEELLLASNELFIIIFSVQLHAYWDELGFSKVLIRNEKKVKDKLYLFNFQDGYIPSEIRFRFNVTTLSTDNKFQFEDKIISVASITNERETRH